MLKIGSGPVEGTDREDAERGRRGGLVQGLGRGHLHRLDLDHLRGLRVAGDAGQDERDQRGDGTELQRGSHHVQRASLEQQPAEMPATNSPDTRKPWRSRG